MINYNQRKKSAPTGNGLLRSLMLVAVSFFSGYMAASFVDIGKIGAWLDSLMPQQSRIEPIPQFAHHTAKPKLEFYTLLTANHGSTPVPPPLPAANTTPTQQNIAVKTTPDAHSVQGNAIHPAGNIVVAKLSKPVEKVAAVKNELPKREMAKGNYSIQVAAMRTRQDAERVKASLLLKGFDVSISSVSSNGALWYRVMVGRFASRDQAEKTQLVLAQRNRMNGMIRKLDA